MNEKYRIVRVLRQTTQKTSVRRIKTCEMNLQETQRIRFRLYCCRPRSCVHNRKFNGIYKMSLDTIFHRAYKMVVDSVGKVKNVAIVRGHITCQLTPQPSPCQVVELGKPQSIVHPRSIFLSDRSTETLMQEAIGEMDASSCLSIGATIIMDKSVARQTFSKSLESIV